MSIRLECVSDFYGNDLDKYNRFELQYFEDTHVAKKPRLPDETVYPMPNPARYNMNNIIIGYAVYDASEFEKYDKYIQKVDVEECAGQKVWMCPISFDEIKTPGITCYGNVYEKSFIEEWVKTHDIDPLCGRILFTKHIVSRGIGLSEHENIHEVQKKIRNNLKLAFRQPFELMYPEVKMQEIRKTQSYISQLKGDDKKRWDKYSMYKKAYFRSPGNCKSGFPEPFFIDQFDEVSRPENTGHGVQFIDISSDPDDKFEFKVENYKSLSFIGADLSNNVFYECKFHRCVFMGAILRGTIFHHCDFSGEEVNFAEAVTDQDTRFIDCMIEDVGSWTKKIYRDDVELCLKHRLLEGNHKIEVIENM